MLHFRPGKRGVAAGGGGGTDGVGAGVSTGSGCKMSHNVNYMVKLQSIVITLSCSMQWL